MIVWLVAEAPIAPPQPDQLVPPSVLHCGSQPVTPPVAAVQESATESMLAVALYVRAAARPEGALRAVMKAALPMALPQSASP